MRALMLALALLAPPAVAGEVTVFAAASLQTALDQIAADWQAQTGHSARITYEGTAKLARQIEAGAPAQVFVSAAENWMDRLEAAELTVPGSRRALLGNTLVLVGSGDAPAFPLADLPAQLAGGKLAMALVDSVPAGQYGHQALTTLGLWPAVAPQVVQADNVRAALRLVARGEAALGIVYASDAVAEPAVGVVATFPDTSHQPITYPAALIAPATPESQALLDYLSSPAAAKVFESQGFEVLR